MKLSYAVSMQSTGFSSIAQGGWARKAAVLSSLGYEGIELAVRDPDALDPVFLSRVLSRNKLKLCAVGTGQMFVDEGLSISSPSRVVRKKAVSRISRHIELAADFGSLVIVGLARGREKTEKGSPAGKFLRESLAVICDKAKASGVTVALEPINRYETGSLNTAQETLSFIKEFRCACLKLLLDTFHMNIEEPDPLKSIESARAYLAHVHFADSNRRFPGAGHIDFGKVVSVLSKIGYDRYLSAEMLSLPDFKTAARTYCRKIRGYLK